MAFQLLGTLSALAHVSAQAPSAQVPPIGKSFGNGVAGFPLCAEPVTLVNHTLSEGATHGVLHHFWSTGGAIKVDRLWVEYFLDGEITPSISYQPSMMCGLASSFLEEFNKVGHTDLYHAGGMCGRNSAVGGYFNTFPIPFQQHALVTVRADPQDCKSGCCGGGYLNVRGTENLPVVLPGSGIPLPITARLHLQKNDWQVAQPAEHVPIINVSSGNGLLFMVTWSVETQPVGGDKAGGGYIEGCWQFYPTADTPYPGFVVGTGVEDYFDSSYYFGADAGIFGPTHQIKDLMFRTDLSGLTYFQRENGTERLSAYRFHNQDPLAFSGGGKLLWWVGQCKPFDKGGTVAAMADGGTTKCGNPYPDHPLPPPPPPPVPPQPPALAGCANGQCDAFCHLDNVRGCAATWDEASLRDKKSSPAPAKSCGGSVPCAVPADACAPGWEICLSDPAAGVDLGQFREAMSEADCATNSSGRFIGAMSHAQPSFQKYEKNGPHGCPPVPLGDHDDNGCNAAGNGSTWGCEPVCCGQKCTVPSCPNSVYNDATRIVINMQTGCCGNFTGARTHVDGVLCCKTKAQQLADAPLIREKARLGRKLTPINVSTYGWYYSY